MSFAIFYTNKKDGSFNSFKTINRDISSFTNPSIDDMIKKINANDEFKDAYIVTDENTVAALMQRESYNSMKSHCNRLDESLEDIEGVFGDLRCQIDSLVNYVKDKAEKEGN